MGNVSEERVLQRLLVATPGRRAALTPAASYGDSSFSQSPATAIIYRTSQLYQDTNLEDGNCSVCRNT
jgi:hypothetical protein